MNGIKRIPSYSNSESLSMSLIEAGSEGVLSQMFLASPRAAN
jgi:hypothetical protein